MAESMAFADRLRELLERRGLTQYALAKRTGISKQVLSYLAAGLRDPSWSTVQRLAAGLGVDCRELADPELAVLPVELAETASRPRGRPRKESATPEPTPTAPPARRTGRKMPTKPKRPPVGDNYH